jgi:hypothetical protein
VTIQKASTQTTVSDVANPVVGQSITYTATVAAQSPGSGSPTGSVTFTGDGGTICTTNLNSSDQATCATSYSGAGSDSVKASYGGDTNYTSSQSSALDVTIGAASTTTSLATSVDDPDVGEPVTFTATVAAHSPGTGTPSGTVAFTGGSGTLCTTQLDGDATDQATCTTSYPSSGTDSVKATYNGTTNFAASTSTAQSESISETSTTTSLTASTSTAEAGQQVTFTAEVDPVSPGGGLPSGEVTFSDGSSGALCHGQLNDSTPDEATCETTFTTTDTYRVTADYQGASDQYAASTSNPINESVSAASTQMVLSSSDSPSVTGESVTFTASVSAVAPSTGVPTGNVVFAVETSTNDTLSCSGGNSQALDSGLATCLITGSQLSVSGSPLYVLAGYEGTSSYNSSQANISQAVGEDAAKVKLKSSKDPSAKKQVVTFTATVSATAPGSGSPTGSVTFSFEPAGHLACSGGDTVTLSSKDKAVCSVKLTRTVTVSAAYGGSSNYDAGSQSLDQTVS